MLDNLCYNTQVIFFPQSFSLHTFLNWYKNYSSSFTALIDAQKNKIKVLFTLSYKKICKILRYSDGMGIMVDVSFWHPYKVVLLWMPLYSVYRIFICWGKIIKIWSIDVFKVMYRYINCRSISKSYVRHKIPMGRTILKMFSDFEILHKTCTYKYSLYSI